jgi:hypothetical protein
LLRNWDLTLLTLLTLLGVFRYRVARNRVWVDCNATNEQAVVIKTRALEMKNLRAKTCRFSGEINELAVA